MTPDIPAGRGTGGTASHYLGTPLRNEDGASWGDESRAVLATAHAPKGCVLFVHGFMGGATDTWLQFPRFFPLEDECRSFDALFWGYDGVRDTVTFSASRLSRLLEAVFSRPAETIVNPSLPRGARPRAGTFRYRSVIICAHSLGAVVSRRAVLDAVLAAKPWSNRLSALQMQFFAPAHKGAKIVRLAEDGLGAFSIPLGLVRVSGSGAAATLKMLFPVLQELDYPSPVLEDLVRDTRHLLEKDAARYGFLRAYVTHARHDRVVNDTSFVLDHETRHVDGQGHRSICKPDLGYLAPLATLIERIGGA